MQRRKRWRMAQRVKQRNMYMYGNTAEEIVPSYVQQPLHEPVRREERRRKEQTRRRAKAHPLHGFDFFTFVFFLGILIIPLYTCFDYLKINSEVTSTKKNIIALENQIMELQDENIAAKESVNSSLDLQEIYKKATKELGMVEATKGQVYTYSNKKSDMVRQYAEIPTENVSKSR